MYVYRPGTRKGAPDRKLMLTDREDQSALQKLAGTIYAENAKRIEAGLSALQRKQPNEDVKKQYQKARKEAIVTARTSLPLTGRLKAK